MQQVGATPRDLNIDGPARVTCTCSGTDHIKYVYKASGATTYTALLLCI